MRLGFGLQGLETRRENGSIATNFAVDVSHDPIGNRKTATEGAQQKAYNANAVNEYVTAGSANLTYDLDGNLTGDGTRRFVYDAENRLTLVEPVTAVNGSTRVRMAYDYLGRRVQKVVEEFDGAAWAAADDVRFLYVGWNVIEERRTSGGVTTKKNFVWGLDLSQSMDGAGGIGGLLAVVDQAGTQMAFLYDANGNVGQLVDEQGAVVARYEYDAFGQTLVAAGAAAEGNAYRFSTKYADAETGLVYYGYRYYDPAMGRWINRDPKEEDGGLNLVAYTANRPINAYDALGLSSADGPSGIVEAIRELAERNGVTLEKVADALRKYFPGGRSLFADIGNAVHQLIFNRYRSVRPNQAEFDTRLSISLPLHYGKSAPFMRGELRPDILNYVTDQYYEAKSIRQFHQGLWDLEKYHDAFTEAGLCQMLPGSPGPETQGFSEGVGGVSVMWTWTAPGLILYEFAGVPIPVRVPSTQPANVQAPDVNQRRALQQMMLRPAPEAMVSAVAAATAVATADAIATALLLLAL